MTDTPGRGGPVHHGTDDEAKRTWLCQAAGHIAEEIAEFLRDDPNNCDCTHCRGFLIRGIFHYILQGRNVDAVEVEAREMVIDALRIRRVCQTVAAAVAMGPSPSDARN